MKNYFILFFLIFLFLLFNFQLNTVCAANLKLKPKIFFDIEQGERYEEVEDDYTDYDYDITKSYKYKIIKFGYKQRINKTSDLSIILKNNDKSFSFSGDYGLSNYSNSILGYYKKDISDILEFKIELNALSRKFDEPVSNDKENLWYAAGISFKISPNNGTNFFASKANIYQLKITYKNQHYYEADYKDVETKGISGEWSRKITEYFRIETRAKFNARKYDVESGQRQNSDKYNIGLRFEYDFNK